jgi:hydrogenase maturation factor
VSVEADELPGLISSSKSTENIEEIQELTHGGLRRTIHELADSAGISYGVSQEI